MFKPLQDRIVIKQDAVDEKIGSIVVPQEAREKPLGERWSRSVLAG